MNRNILPIFRRRDARQNEEEDSEAEESPEGGDGATGQARREEGAVEAGEAEGTLAAAAGRPVITVRVTQDAETGRRTFNIRQVHHG